MSRWLAPVLLLWLSASPLHAQTKLLPALKTIPDLLDDRHIIGTGDTVSLRALEDRRDVEQHRVPESGIIEFRYVGAVKAGGLTCRKLARLIRQKLLADPAHSPPITYSSSPTVVVALANVTHCGPPTMDELDNTNKLKPRDTVGIRILEDRRQEMNQIIAEDGEIQPPYLPVIQAAGLTCQKLAFKIKTELEKSAFKNATVIVTRYETPEGALPVRFAKAEFMTIFGTVAKEGKYLMPPDRDTTVTNAIQQAGGINPTNSKPKIWIIRTTPQGKKSILVPAQALLVQKRREYDLFLRPGDCVIIK